MKFSRVTFTWGTQAPQPVRWRVGLFAVYERQSVRFGLTDALVISVRGLLLWCLALAIAGWLGAATVLSRVLAKRPHNSVTWSDCVLLPVRWRVVKAKRGDAYIKEGLEDFSQSRWRDGAARIAAGLTRNPATRAGRRELASFYLAARLRPRALTTLLDGLNTGDFDRTYFEDVVNTALQGDDFETALEACDRAEKRWLGDGKSADARWLQERHLMVLVRAGRVEEALRMQERWQLDTSAANEVRVAALLELKRFAEAFAAVDAAEAQAGVQPATLQLRAHVAAAAVRTEELDRALSQLRLSQGDQAGYYVFATGKWLQAGNRVAAERLFEAFRLRFSSNARALEEMAAEVAKHADVELLDRCVEVAREHGQPSRVLYTHLFDAAIVRGDWAAAQHAAVEIERAPASTDAERRNSAMIRQLVAALVSEADGVQRQLVETCRSQNLPLPTIKFMHAALVRASRFATARDVADFGTLLYPGSRFLAEARSSSSARADELASQVAQGRAEQIAAYAAAETGVRKELEALATTGVVVAPGGEDEFFAALETAKQAADWTHVVSLIASVRYQRPVWLPEREADVLRLEIEARRQRGDALELIVAIRAFLNGSIARSEEIITLARELDAAGNRTLARAALAEVVKKSPDLPEATDLLKTWMPPGPPAPGGDAAVNGEAVDLEKKG